jgi:hypothetical protein
MFWGVQRGAKQLTRSTQAISSVVQAAAMLVLLAIFGQQSHDLLAFNDTRRFRHDAQATRTL